jgi:4-amino-4-deoxy-L-arabinose transferase-like glycosyltransferase
MAVRFRHFLALSILLTAFVVLAMGYSVLIPPGEGVDELPHFDYVRYVKEHRSLPVQPLSYNESVEVWMGHHPPLYYTLAGLAISWTDTSDFTQVFRPNPHFVWQENVGSNGWNVMLHFGQDEFPWRGSVLALHVVRLMTVGLGAVALYAIYRVTQLLLPDHPWAPLGATALAGFNPSFIFMASTIHHDTLQAAIFALSTWWALRFLKGPERWYETWLGGILLGAAWLTKLSGLSLVPVVGLVLVLKAWRSRNWRKLIPQALCIFVSATLVAGWWFIRNQRLYGDLLGWQMFLNLHRHMARSAPYTLSEFSAFLQQIGRTFWGAFGYMHITFPRITKCLWWLTSLAGIGLVVGLLRGRLVPRAHWAEWLIALMVPILLFASFVRFSIATIGAGHGRYLFPAGASIGALLIAGLNGFTAWRHQRAISIAMTIGMIVYAVWLPVKLVLPKYSTPKTTTVDQLTEITPVGAVLAGTLELIGYQSNADLVMPGQWIHVNLYWRAIGSSDERLDPQVHLQAVDDQGNVIASSTSWPVPSLPPAVWESVAVYVTHMYLGIPVQELTGQIHLRVGASLKGNDGYVLSQDAAGNSCHLVPIGDILAIGSVTEVSPDVVPNPRSEVFASTLALLGFELPSDPIPRGSAGSVSLYWQVLEQPDADYTVFIHVLNDQGELVTQFDRPPGGGTTPTSTWEVGQTLRDTYPLPIPPDVPADTYTVRIGMYTWPSLERLPVMRNGRPVGDGVELGSIEIQP